MVVAIRILGLFVGWYVLNGLLGLATFMNYSDFDGYSIVYVWLFSLVTLVKLGVAGLLLIMPEKVLCLLGARTPGVHTGEDAALALGLASLAGVYFLVEGLSQAFSIYLTARVQSAEVGFVSQGLMVPSVFAWPLQQCLHGFMQAAPGLTVLLIVSARFRRRRAPRGA